jgi:hypothetical protein
VREPKELHTLPRRSIFGKDIDASPRVFKVLYVLLFPTEALFFGKVVLYRYRGTMLRITIGTSFIGKNTNLQVPEILVVLRYRRF